MGVAGGALALAGGLAAFPAISEGIAAFAAAEFVLPSIGGGGLVIAGVGSTGGAVIGGGRIYGGEILAGLGILGGTAVFMEYKDALEAARNELDTNPDFRRYFHRVYKPEMKLPSFTRNNPNMGPKHILDALIEWVEQGCPIVK